MSGIDQWAGIRDHWSGTRDGYPRSELVLARRAFHHNAETNLMLRGSPRGSFLKDGWKMVMGERCTLRCPVFVYEI